MAKVRTKGGKRRCSRCEKFKARAEFPPNKATRDGLALYCRTCKRESARKRPKSVEGFVDLSGDLAKILTKRKAHQAAAADDAGDVDDESRPPPRKKLPGRVSTITPELIDKLCEVLELGHSRRVAARRAGIDEDLLAQWMHRGLEAPAGQPTRVLFEAVMAAEGEGQGVLEDSVLLGARLDPNLALRALERKASEDWGRREHLSVSNADKPMETADVRQLLLEQLNKLIPELGTPGGAAPEPAGASAPPAAAPAGGSEGATPSVPA